jgi:hypothetical protein
MSNVREKDAGIVDSNSWPSAGGENVKTDHINFNQKQGWLEDRKREFGGGLGDSSEFLTSSGRIDHANLRLGKGAIYSFLREFYAGVGDAGRLFDAHATIDTADLDSEGHNYFIGTNTQCYRYVDCTGEPWDVPTSHLYNGYARDGTKYTNGVQDSGPVWAPWAAEAAGVDRSSRKDFPRRALIISNTSEVVIFDLDSWPQIKMWMRFRLGSGTSWTMLGSASRYPVDIRMWNGILCTISGDSDSYLAVVDFKQVTAPIAYLVGTSNPCYVWTTGKTVVDRNTWNFTTTGGISGIWWGGSAYGKQIAIYNDGSYRWLVAATSRGLHVIRCWDRCDTSYGNLHTSCGGVCFDKQQEGHWTDWLSGTLFAAFGTYVVRNELEYKNQIVIADTEWYKRSPGLRSQNYVNLRATVYHLVPAPPYIFAVAANGIWRIHQGTLEAEQRYATALDPRASYKILPWAKRLASTLRVHSNEFGHFLAAATDWLGADYGNAASGGIALIRDNDHTLLKSVTYPDLPVDGLTATDIMTF